MLPVWFWILLGAWVILTVYLLWRWSGCKCRRMEGFATKKEKFSKKKEDGEKDSEEGMDDEDNEDTGIKKGKLVIAGKETYTDKETEKDADKEDDTDKKETVKKSEVKKDKVMEKMEDKENEKEEPKNGKKSSTVKDQLLNYGEMKIFEGLRDNMYSMTDIKRMIKEGDINEKMIEKFLARIEKMENKQYTKKTLDKESTVEGFTGNSYASAVFS